MLFLFTEYVVSEKSNILVIYLQGTPVKWRDVQKHFLHGRSLESTKPSITAKVNILLMFYIVTLGSVPAR